MNKPSRKQGESEQDYQFRCIMAEYETTCDWCNQQAIIKAMDEFGRACSDHAYRLAGR